MLMFLWMKVKRDDPDGAAPQSSRCGYVITFKLTLTSAGRIALYKYHFFLHLHLSIFNIQQMIYLISYSDSRLAAVSQPNPASEYVTPSLIPLGGSADSQRLDLRVFTPLHFPAIWYPMNFQEVERHVPFFI